MRRTPKSKNKLCKRGLIGLGDKVDLSGLMATVTKIGWELFPADITRINLTLELDHEREKK